jgi:hypothetical protein
MNHLFILGLITKGKSISNIKVEELKEPSVVEVKRIIEEEKHIIEVKEPVVEQEPIVEKIEENIEHTFTFEDIYLNSNHDIPVEHKEINTCPVIIRQKSNKFANLVSEIIVLKKYQKDGININGWKI